MVVRVGGGSQLIAIGDFQPFVEQFGTVSPPAAAVNCHLSPDNVGCADCLESTVYCRGSLPVFEPDGPQTVAQACAELAPYS